MFTQMRSTLRQAGVSASAKLYAVVGIDVAASLLDGPVGTFDVQAPTAGNGDNRPDAAKAMGVVRGFEVYESSRLAPDEAIGFIREAFALTVRAPEMPQGVGTGRSFRENGFALRWLADYVSSVASDRSLVATFVGAKALPLAVPDELTGTVQLVTNGGTVRTLAES